MLAHIRHTDKKRQKLDEHCRDVACLCQKTGELLGIPALAYLTGLLHDMGKGTAEFQKYLLWGADHPGERKEHQRHAVTGAIYCWERWQSRNLFTAQIIALCVCGHHTGLHDCLSPDGSSPFLSAMASDKERLNYREAVSWFESQIAAPEELDELFEKAHQELDLWLKKKQNAFSTGTLTRLLLSILVDADRWDSACFEYDVSSLEGPPQPNWSGMIACLQNYMKETFKVKTDLDTIRSAISDTCAAKAKGLPGIYSLSVPTGGGKTFASLRFALLHAEEHQMKRIFYIIPYNTILDQNAADIRAALGDSGEILEHHSNIVIEDEGEEAEYKRLTERWDSQIILTSLVQFLNALFLGKNSSARRMHQLTDAVLIFDEIQSLPKHCKTLFEKAIRFLVESCHCTVVLCTATQPKLNLSPEPIELMENVDALYQRLRRVRYVDETKPEIDNQTAASRICSLLEDGRSVLGVVNTKSSALAVYNAACQILREGGWNLLELPDFLTDDELKQRTEVCGPHDILCVHLSTFLCPAHRLERLRAVKVWTKAKKPVLCVSTALIEAGINVSFPVVVRSIAGLPSVIQAGGRCNRNCEEECGTVYLWSMYEEKNALRHLPDIQNGQQLLSNLLCQYRDRMEGLGSPEAIGRYFAAEESYTDRVKDYPYPNKDRKTGWESSNLVNMLSANKACKQASRDAKAKAVEKLVLCQSFRTAGEVFRVIDEDTTAVLVPYGEGKEIITALFGSRGMKEFSRLLRKAQGFSVNLYPNVFRGLREEGALIPVRDTGLYVLKEEYYNGDGGVSVTASEMATMIY